MDTSILLESSRMVPSLFQQFVGVRYTDINSTITSGSLRHIPDIYLGTIDWLFWREGMTYFIPSHEAKDDLTSSHASFPSLGNAIRLLASKIVQLEKAVEMGYTQVFIETETTINWENLSPSLIMQGIQMALAIDAPLSARRLAMIGNQQYPDHTELRRYAQVLAPPKVLSKGVRSHTALKVNRDWIMMHGDRYRGQWVALKNGELLGTASSLQDLINKVERSKDVLFTKVF